MRLRRRLISAAWLGLLAAFILLGVPYASFHGDETSFIYSSHDYDTLFIRHDPQALFVDLPIDTEMEYLRLADGSLARYSIGLAWHLGGYGEADLPAHNFNWYVDYAANRADGRIPELRALTTARLPSALFLALSVAVMFGIGACFGGLPMAFFVSGLYAFNPIVLLNGRRAMQEGGLLLFGLLTVYIGILIARRREQGRAVGLPLWIGLTLAGALAFISKNSGFIYIAAAFLWIFLPEMLHLRLRSFFSTGIKLALCGVAVIVLFIALSPGLWSDPAARLQNAALVRIAAIGSQMQGDPEAPSSMERRVNDILTQPFMQPLAHYDTIHDNTYAAQRDLIAAYNASPISGIHFGVLLGVPLTLLALFGVIANFLPRLRPYRSPTLSVGLLAWLVVNIAVLVWLPLPWQRYFLPLIPVATIFAAVGLWSLVRLIRPLVGRRTLTKAVV